MNTVGPIFSRRQLRIALREARRQRDLTLDQVAKQAEFSTSKIVRIEAGDVTVSPSDLRILLDLYDIADEAQRAELTQLGRRARQRTWTSKYRNRAPASLLWYAAYEREATRILQYHPIVIPDLAQTQAYARALAFVTDDLLPPEHRGGTVEVLWERQADVFRSDGPEVVLVVDEPALARPIGGVGVHREQADHLLDLAGRPQVTVVVRPGALGPPSGCAVLEFAGSAGPALVFVDEPRGTREVDQDSGANGYRWAFDRMLSAAVDARPALEHLRSRI